MGGELSLSNRRQQNADQNLRKRGRHKPRALRRANANQEQGASEDILAKLAERSSWEQRRRQQESSSGSWSNSPRVRARREPSIFDHNLGNHSANSRSDSRMDILVENANQERYVQQPGMHQRGRNASSVSAPAHVDVKREPSDFEYNLANQILNTESNTRMDTPMESVKQEPGLDDHILLAPSQATTVDRQDTQLLDFFRARCYNNPVVLETLIKAGLTKYELRSMKGLSRQLIVDRFRLVLPPECQGPAQIESLAFAVAYASEEDWEALNADA